ncbi:2744_t:CDS:2, partial [Entrophospora sp. SA101]
MTSSIAASTVIIKPTTPLVMGTGGVSSGGGSGYLSKNRSNVIGIGNLEDKDNKEKENGNGGNGLIGLTRQQYIPSPTNEIHPLHFTWVFWFMHRTPGSKILNYESSMKKIAAFSSIEDFWAVYSHLRKPHELPNISDYHLFKQGVRPVWEVMAVIGDQFDVGSEICGAVLSIRSSEDILSLWNQSAHEGRINLKIRDTMKRVLNLPSDTIMEYKTHNDALKDNSSFRNTD